MSMSTISRISVVKCLGPRLAPFFKSVALFYVLCPQSESSITYCFFKCVPIICLILFVLMYGMRIQNKKPYSQKILLGLIFSCIGDAFLALSSSYNTPLGMTFFAVAQLLYISAFGCRPRALAILPIVLFLFAAIFIYSCSQLTGFVRFISPIYGGLLSIMIWRAVALPFYGDRPLPWTSISRALGAVLFGVSDAALSVQMFRNRESAISTIVLPTYYAAQMCIAVSVVDRQLNSFKAASAPT